MLTLKMTRDQARMIEQNFLPFILMNCQVQIHDNADHLVRYLSKRVMLSLMREIDVIFKRRLLGTGNKMNIKLSDAHAIVFYVKMMEHPVEDKEVHMILLRQKICDYIYQQLIDPTVEYNQMQLS